MTTTAQLNKLWLAMRIKEIRIASFEKFPEHGAFNSHMFNILGSEFCEKHQIPIHEWHELCHYPFNNFYPSVDSFNRIKHQWRTRRENKEA